MTSKEVGMMLNGPRHAAAAVLGANRITRIVPVAWPLVKSEWNVIVSVSEPTGLVDRFVLRALRDFGPCSVSELDALLCLGEERTESAVEEMIRIGAPIQKIPDGKYSVPKDTEIDEFRTKHEHRFAFLLGGLSGNLLPPSMYFRIKQAILTEDDLSEMKWIVRLPPIVTGAESPALRDLNPSRALKASEADGIPYGFRKLSGKAPLKESVIYALGFFFTDLSGNGILLAATEAAEEIATPKGYLFHYPALQQVVSSPTAPMPDIGETAVVRINRPEPGKNTLAVSVLDDSAWRDAGSEERPDLAHQLAGRLFRTGWFWSRFGEDQSRWCYYELRSGDARTERSLWIRKAALALSNHADEISDESAFADWLALFLEQNAGGEAMAKPPTTDEVLAAALERKEGDVMALASRLRKERGDTNRGSGDNLKSRPTAIREFLNSSDPTFAQRIVELIRNARDSVSIVSPVVEEDKVFKALGEAVQRNVSVRIVTQLGNHRTGQFVTTPEFAGYDIPRRQLAKLGASVRDWNVTVHAKMVLTDGNRFLFSTANMNGNSLGTGAKNAVEAAFLFEGGPEVNAGKRLFEAIWDGSETRQIKRDDRIAIVRQASKVRFPLAEDCAIRIGETEFVLSTPTNQFLAKRLATLIRFARKKILVSTMSIYDLEKVPIVFQAFCGALSRGVEVTVLARPGAEQNFKPSDWPDPSTKKLMAQGMKVVEVPRLHAKGIFVDDDIGLMTSANLNPYSLGDLETSHVEIAIQAPLTMAWMKEFHLFAKSLTHAGRQ